MPLVRENSQLYEVIKVGTVSGKPVAVSGVVSTSGTTTVTGNVNIVSYSGGALPVTGVVSTSGTTTVTGNVNSSPAPALLTTYNVAGVIAINTILVSLDCSQYRSVSIQCTSMGTAGVVTPEWSNDNTTWNGGSIITAVGASATTFSATGLWTTPSVARYFRLRLSTATTAGTTTISLHQFDDSRQMWLATQPVSLSAATTLLGDVGVQYRTTATGTASVVSVLSPATPAAATIKGSAGRLLGCVLQNSATSLRSVKVFNATAPTLGTTAATFEIDIPSSGNVVFNFEGGIGFATAMTYSVTSAKGLTDNTSTGLGANDVSGFFSFA